MAGLGAPSMVPLTTDVVGVSNTLASSATDGEGALWLEYANDSGAVPVRPLSSTLD